MVASDRVALVMIVGLDTAAFQMIRDDDDDDGNDEDSSCDCPRSMALTSMLCCELSLEVVLIVSILVKTRM